LFDWITVLFTSIPWAIIIIYVLKNPEKAEKWYSILARIFSFFGKRAELAHVASDIQADINLSAKEINTKAMEPVMPYGVKIEWANDITREAFIASNEVVVRMRYHKNQARNFLYATLSYVEEGLIPFARPHVDKVVLKATQYHAARKMMTRRNRHSSLKIFYDEFFEPEKAKEPALENYFKTMDSIDENGLFETILLHEFLDLGLEMFNRSPRADVMNETRDFVHFMNAIVTKEPDEDVPIVFNGAKIYVHISLIDRAIYLQQGIKPYVDDIMNLREEKVKSVYLCAMSHVPVLAAKGIATFLEKEGTFRRIGETKRKFRFHGVFQEGVCIALKPAHA